MLTPIPPAVIDLADADGTYRRRDPPWRYARTRPPTHVRSRSLDMAQYQAPPPPAANDPGATLGLVGMILAIIPCTYFIGLILSVVAFFMSRRAGFANQKALIGIIVG